MASIQWISIAGCLYAEMAFIVLLLLPFISPGRWVRIFNSRLVKFIVTNSGLMAAISFAVIALSLWDAFKDMSKYSGEKELKTGCVNQMDCKLQLQVKLFRAQRNFYITLFTLFLCLVLYRLVVIISKYACSEQENMEFRQEYINKHNEHSQLKDEHTALKRQYRELIKKSETIEEEVSLEDVPDESDA